MSYNIKKKCTKEIDTICARASQFVNSLLKNEVNTKTGINVCIEAPYDRNHNLNILRKGVLRQYFGMDRASNNNFTDIVYRYAYGMGSGSACKTVGSSISNITTRPINFELRYLMTEVHKIVFKDEQSLQHLFGLRRHKDQPICKDMFNHVTILLYYSVDGIKKVSSMGKHCDITYSKEGKYQASHNTQTENSLTVSLTIGDSRIVNFFRRYYYDAKTDGKNANWIDIESPVASYTLEHGDIMVLHPDDERPFSHKDTETDTITQFQHGEVNVDDGRFSVGFLFRNVRSIEAFERKDSTLSFKGYSYCLEADKENIKCNDTNGNERKWPLNHTKQNVKRIPQAYKKSMRKVKKRKIA